MIFAFDNLKDAPIIEKKLELWRNHYNKETVLYVLCGFEGQGGEEIDGVFQRIEILSRYKCKPYIMRHKNYLGTPHEGMFINLARWCNQPQFLMKQSFRQYIETCQSLRKTPGFVSAPLKAMQKFEADYPDIAEKWFDRNFGFSLRS